MRATGLSDHRERGKRLTVRELRNCRPCRTRSGRQGTAQQNIDIHIFYTYNIRMSYQYNLKPVTLYVGAQLYEDYQIQAQKQGRKASELIRNAMQDYADEHFKTKKSLRDIDFSRTVSLRDGASDFLKDDSWKDDFISGRVKL